MSRSTDTQAQIPVLAVGEILWDAASVLAYKEATKSIED